MEDVLNATGYRYNQVNYTKEFERLLAKIVLCYNLMVIDKVNFLKKDENKIRDVLLLNYLRNDIVRRNIALTDFLFDREVPEDKTIGRTDIKVQTLDTFKTQEAYYILECKRLDNKAKRGSSGLNAKYVEHGICRFVSNYYNSYFQTNAMIGFIVEKMNIHSNTNDINFILQNNYKAANPISAIKKESFIPNFAHQYSSEHITTNNSKIKLYHLMLDVSKQVI